MKSLSTRKIQQRNFFQKRFIVGLKKNMCDRHVQLMSRRNMHGGPFLLGTRDKEHTPHVTISRARVNVWSVRGTSYTRHNFPRTALSRFSFPVHRKKLYRFSPLLSEDLFFQRTVRFRHASRDLETEWLGITILKTNSKYKMLTSLIHFVSRKMHLFRDYYANSPRTSIRFATFHEKCWGPC